MTIINRDRSRGLAAWLMALALVAMPLAALGQTRVEVPKNKYSVNDDVQAGQQAAQQVRQQMPLLRDTTVDNLVQSVGRRLVSAIPSEFQHPEFRYTFEVVDARDINAFALPGGPTFVNRGMIETARNEGELAGVMAHELSHVALRHSTAQATETQKFQIGSVLGQIAGAVIGGGIGQVVGAGSQIGFGAGALKYSRKYESQADILGAQIMARAGYDPRDLANVFRTIEQQGGSGGPEWLSDHPNPGNRYERIQQEAAMLRVNTNAGAQDTRAFRDAQARLRGFPRARTMAEIAQSGQRYPNQSGGNPEGGNYPQQQDDNYTRGERVAYPSARYRQQGNNFFRAAIPDNWQQTGGDGNSISYAPAGASGQQGITHGVMFGTEQSQSANLRQGTQQLVNGLLQGSNSYLRQQGAYQPTTLNGRNALTTTLTGRSPITGRAERVTIVTTLLGGNGLFYMAGVAPSDEYGTYQRTFQDIMRSLQLSDQN
ncbi:MAG: M48 family metalloprotease [Pyrinomonadaceae bacterium]